MANITKHDIRDVLSPFYNVSQEMLPGDLSSFIANRFIVDEPLFEGQKDRVMQYLQKTVVPHKIAVYEAGMEIFKLYSDAPGFSISNFRHNLVVHDASKFSSNEALAYALHDFKSKEPDSAFDMAWLHHKHNNPHHPEYWLDVNKEGEVTTLPMPRLYVAEMVADWVGAGKVYGNSLESWLPTNLPKFLFHRQTMRHLVPILDECFDIQTEIVAGPFGQNKIFVR